MISLFSPFIPPETGEEVKKTIDSGWINRGKKAQMFENKISEMFSFPYCHAVNSGTSALKLALDVAGVSRGNEVISTPWTMIATNTSILENGAIPVFSDIKYDTLNIDPNDIEDRITNKTKALVCVHYAGYPCDMDEIIKIGKEHDLPVIQDAAQALGAKYKGKCIGSFGDSICFSFQTIKVITMGDGGLIVTNTEERYKEIKRKSWFGIDKEKRISSPLGTYPKDITELGFKYDITDIDATLGLVGLRYIEEALKKRKNIAERYFEELSSCRKIRLLDYRENKSSSYWMFPIHVNKRLSFAKYMKDNDIEVSVHNWRNDKYSIFGGIQDDLPNTSKVNEDIIHIPLHPNLTDEDVDYVIKKVKEWDSNT
jgi:perosamine synthetase